jgi:hypothetical protein
VDQIALLLKANPGALNGSLLHSLIRYFYFVDHFARGRIDHWKRVTGIVGKEVTVNEIL